MDERAVTLLTNQFAKTAYRVGPSQLSRGELALMRCDGGWLLCDYVRGLKIGTIGAWVPDNPADLQAEPKPQKLCKRFKLPTIEGDDIDAAILIAANISFVLKSYASHAKAVASRPEGTQKVAGGKGGNARWHGN